MESISGLKARRVGPAGLATLALILLAVGPLSAQSRLRIVTTLPTYAAIAREITGELAQIDVIARGDEDPHYVNPRPSFAAVVGKADVLVTTGLDLELWVPAVIDRARNPRVIEGGPGNVVAYSGIKLLQVPENVSRAGGDVHIYGNPHIHTDPINAIIIGRNILATLERLDPQHASTYESNARAFEDRIMRRLYGDQLVDMLGFETIFDLARTYEFWDFARNQRFQGKPLTEYVGGWMAEAAPFRDQIVACYHKNWAYFSARFRVDCAIYIEPKPGIPPSPGHLREVVDFMRDKNVKVLFAANYFSHSQIERVAQRTGARAVIVPEHVSGAEGVDDYFELIDMWVSGLAQAFLSEDRRSGDND
jgi:ABC-type Zn uptake system ZnuABC Zn-binding protein ZnuA